jgi:hypothetical protein
MEAIVFPDGTQVPATPGKYRIVPPPNLNDLIEGRFLLEYDFPFLLVQDMSTRASSDEEQNEANRQAGNWRVHHPQIKAKVGGCRLGYQLNKPPSRRARGCHRQFIPDISYVDERTWCRLSPEEWCIYHACPELSSKSCR